MADDFGEKNYRDGAIERIGEASLLLRAEQFAGAVYLAGRAVEGMLRALIWKTDIDIRQGKKSLSTGNLQQMLALVRDFGLLREHSKDDLEAQVQKIARLWYNNMRFASSKYVETRWLKLGEVRKGRPFKLAATDYFSSCSTVIKRCEVLCGKKS